MSGNKIPLLLFALIFLQGCFLFKDKPEPEPRDEKEDTTGVVIDVDTIRPGIDTIDGVPKEHLKDVYNVAILLPFSLDSRMMETFDLNNGRGNYRPLLSLEFYEGVKMALKDLEKYGVDLNVRVYDTRNDPRTVERLTNRPSLQKADLIIGPFFHQNIKVIADFARENKIFMISPVMTKIAIDKPNPFYIQATPTMKSHAVTIGKYIKTRYPRSKVFVVRENDNEELAEWIHLAKSAYQETPPIYGEVTNWKDRPVEHRTNFSKTDFTILDTSIVFIASYDQILIEQTTQQLQQIAKSRPVVVVGMPHWLDQIQQLEDDDIFKRLNELNLHFTLPYWSGRTPEQKEEFKLRVLDSMNVAATGMTFKGYDLMMMMGYMLENYGINFSHYFHDLPQEKWDIPFIFQPVYVNPTSIFRPSNVKYYENVNVPVMRYQDYELRKMRN